MKIYNDVILLHLKLCKFQNVNELAVNGTDIMSVDSAFASYFAQCMQYECIWNCIMWFMCLIYLFQIFWLLYVEYMSEWYVKKFILSLPRNDYGKYVFLSSSLMKEYLHNSMLLEFGDFCFIAYHKLKIDTRDSLYCLVWSKEKYFLSVFSVNQAIFLLEL